MLNAISSKSILILCIIVVVGCSSMDKLNKYNLLGYTFLINGTDTLSFDRIYLDNTYRHSFKIDKNLGTISYYSTTDSLTQLLNFKQIEELYKDSAQQIAFLIFQSDLIGIEDQCYIQRSLLANPERIKDEIMATIRCNGRQGDVLIFE